MKPSNREKGNTAEKIAAEYLIKKGYQVRHMNWQYGHKEIDIVAMDKFDLVIIEVKMRESDFFENPEDAVSRQKIRFLLDAAEAYQDKFNLTNEIRFDVVAILMKDKKVTSIEHFEDAFIPPVG